MKEIMLAKGKVSLVDDSDYEKISEFAWTISGPKKWKYASRIENGTTILLHRFIMDAPEGYYVDHIDGNGLNNCKINLRLCTNQQNQFNSKKRLNTSSPYKGVCWDKEYKKWKVTLRFEGRTKNIGRYETAQDAAQAYNEFVLKHRGEFAKLNVI